MILISALYPNSGGGRFDADYYLQKHQPFAAQLLGPLGLIGTRITIGEAALDGTPPPFWAISEMQFSSRDAFDRAMGECGAALMADAAVYTDCTPILQISTLT